MSDVRTRRLVAGDRGLARRMFAMMAEVFEEDGEHLSDAYVDRLLSRQEFWAIAALEDDDIVGGLTAHALPMTRAESSELFIYDVAVRVDRRRTGVGRRLMNALREAAATAGIGDVFVPADDDDAHARDFYRALGGLPSRVTIFTFAPPAARR